jgi:hypothetical protein
MLGYAVPQKSELKLREFEIYQAYYCAVCHAIRDRVGQLPRLMLSYDAVFLAMMIESPLTDDENISEFRCLTHPWRRRNIAEVTPGIAYAADRLVLLGYNKLVDDANDEHKIRGIFGKIGLKRAYRKVRALYPEKAVIIEGALELQARLELDEESSLDQLAEPSAIIMEEVFDWPGLRDGLRVKPAMTREGGCDASSREGGCGAALREGGCDASPREGDGGAALRGCVGDTSTIVGYADSLRLAYRLLGRELGRWVYIVDAVDDLTDDVKSGAFNPLKLGEYSRERLELTLKMSLATLAETADLLPLRRNRAVVENIIYVGLNMKTDEVIRKNYEEIVNG